MKSQAVLTRVTQEQAEKNLARVIERVRRGATVLITRENAPVAVLANYDDLTDYLETLQEQTDSGLQRQIREGKRQHDEGKARPVGDFICTLGCVSDI